MYFYTTAGLVTHTTIVGDRQGDVFRARRCPVDFVRTCVGTTDDGSTSEEARDTLSDLAAEFGDIEFVRQANAGPSIARNLGVDRLRTPITGFLDADDSLRADSIERRLSHFAQHPDLIGAYTGFSVIGKTGSDGGSRFNASHAAPLDSDGVGKRIPGGLPLWLMKTETLRAVGGFDPQLQIMEDFDLLLRIGKQGGLFAGDNEPTYLRNVRSNSHSRSSARKVLSGRAAFLRKASRSGHFSSRELVLRWTRLGLDIVREILGRRSLYEPANTDT